MTQVAEREQAVAEVEGLLLTVLYRFFDHEGDLLYVGITDDLRARIKWHARFQPWWPEVDQTRTRVEWIGSRPLAEQAEMRAIYAEDPRRNRVRATAEGRAVRPWQPKTPEQASLLDRIIRATRKADKLREQADRATDEAWNLVVEARPDIPDLGIVTATGWSRATLNRRYGARNAIRWTGDNLDEIQEIRPDARLNDKGDLEVEHVDRPGEYVIVGRNYVVHRRESAS